MKNPTLILCDEVTSSVDAFAERDIVDTLRRASEQRTTLTGVCVCVYVRVFLNVCVRVSECVCVCVKMLLNVFVKVLLNV